MLLAGNTGDGKCAERAYSLALQKLTRRSETLASCISRFTARLESLMLVDAADAV